MFDNNRAVVICKVLYIAAYVNLVVDLGTADKK